MAKISDLTLTGKSGKKYDFEVYSIDTAFNEVAAVYAVTKRYKNSSNEFKHTVIYIGQTDNLKERHDNHHKEECFKRNDANCICVHQDSNEKSRLAKEADLIAAYDPPCNG